MNMEAMQVGARVRVKKSNEATFQAYGSCKTKGNYNTWVDEPVRPWYPHGQIGTIYQVSDCYCWIRTEDGKEWKLPIGFWGVELVND